MTTTHVLERKWTYSGTNTVGDSVDDEWNTSGTNGNTVLTDTRIGSKNPFHRSQIRNGINATTDFTGTKWTVEGNESGSIHTGFRAYRCSNGSYNGQLDAHWEGHIFDMALPNDPSGLVVDAADASARIQFLQQIRKAQRTFNGLTFVGELAEAIRMVRRPASSLRRGIDAYYHTVKKRTKKAPPSSKARIIGDTWLEYSFGWKPLVNDIDDGMKLIAERNIERKTIRVAGYGDSSTSSLSNEVNVSEGWCTAVYRSNTVSRVSVRYLGGVSFTGGNPGLSSRKSGFDTSNFVPAVWELIPYSFLVDYFSNIGKVIDAASVRGFTTSWRNKTVHKTATKTVAYARNNFVFQTCAFGNTLRYEKTYAYASAPGFRITRARVERTIPHPTIVGVKDISFRIPGTDDPWKWLNIAGLALVRS